MYFDERQYFDDQRTLFSRLNDIFVDKKIITAIDSLQVKHDKFLTKPFYFQLRIFLTECNQFILYETIIIIDLYIHVFVKHFLIQNSF